MVIQTEIKNKQKGREMNSFLTGCLGQSLFNQENTLSRML
jgi:hypothetical protein